MAHVLMLDDEPHVLAALRRCVRQHLREHMGQEVHCETYTDPHAALRRLHDQVFDLVVSDFRMPEMDGIVFLRHASERQPHAQRMIVSASTDTSTLMSAVNDVGVFRYLVKPWQTLDLIDALTQALAHGALQREQRLLADAMRARQTGPDAIETERQRLEAAEPGITRVNWGPNGEILMPPLP